MATTKLVHETERDGHEVRVTIDEANVTAEVLRNDGVTLAKSRSLHAGAIKPRTAEPEKSVLSNAVVKDAICKLDPFSKLVAELRVAYARKEKGALRKAFGNGRVMFFRKSR